MYSQGFVKVAAVSPKIKAGLPSENAKEIIKILNELEEKKVSFALFPELTICGYSIGDLVYQEYMHRDNNNALKYILENNNFNGIAIIGTFLKIDNNIFNVGYVIKKNEILGVIPKWYLPHTHEFNENRWFVSGYEVGLREVLIFDKYVPFGQMIFESYDSKLLFGVEICQDMWSPLAPHEILYCNGAQLVFNVSASPETIGKSDLRSSIIKSITYRNNGAYIYASNNMSESTSEVIFSNHKLIYSNGDMIADVNDLDFQSNYIIGDIDLGEINHRRITSSWSKNTQGKFADLPRINFEIREDEDFLFERNLELLPFVPKKEQEFYKIIEMQAASVYKRLEYIGINKVILGVSGGLDSTLALLSLNYMFEKYNLPKENLIAVTLPTKNTSNLTFKNALQLIKFCNAKHINIDIDVDVERQLDVIGHNKNDKDVTYENIQARFRTYTLMNLANLHGAIVIGTSDMSEVALGWSTFNGDQMAMYGINAGLPKTAVKAVVKFYKSIYKDLDKLIDSIIDTPISPELTGNDQATEDIIGKYEVNDFILYRFLACGDSEHRISYLINKFMNLSKEESDNYVKNFFNRFLKQQFKRLTMPESVKIFSVGLSPRSEFKINGDIHK
ncbi:MAG: NAD(+) synthase [Bacilli bacterium]